MALVIISALILFLWFMSHLETHTWEIGGEYHYAEYNEVEDVWYGRSVYEADPLFLRVECVYGQMHIQLATPYFKNWKPYIRFGDFGNTFSIEIARADSTPSNLVIYFKFPIMTLFCIAAFYPAILFCRGPLRRYFSRHEKLLNILYVGGPFVCLFIAFLFVLSLLVYFRVYCISLVDGILGLRIGSWGNPIGLSTSSIPAIVIERTHSFQIQFLPYTLVIRSPLHISIWIPLWFPFMIFAYYPFYKRVYIPLMQKLGRHQPDNPNPCSKCGYNLTGNLSGICPECGTPTQ